MTGGGKYEDITTIAREFTKAEGVIVIVFGGQHGDGFSVQATMPVLLHLPDVLRTMADSIEKDTTAAVMGPKQ